ncbi:hypothetical protein B0H14DRAFT_2727455 [Mycena olivaceomarginata]|nr:hypothetical protein B0H14DRAFT_2727455 [Mycena olivaceomarginata]
MPPPNNSVTIRVGTAIILALFAIWWSVAFSWLSHLSRCDSVMPEMQALAKGGHQKRRMQTALALDLSRVTGCRARRYPPVSAARLEWTGPSSSRHHAPLDAQMTLNVPHAFREQQL